MGIDAKMLVKTKENVTPEQVLKIAYRMASTFGAERFWIRRDTSPMEHCLTIINEYWQDGDSVFPEEGEVLIEPHFFTRYYGVGYERGDIMFLIGVAEFLETHIPGGIIYYGGDSSGVCATPFDKTERERIWRHFLERGHFPYVNEGWFNDGEIEPPTCDLCLEPMVRYRFGNHGQIAGFLCTGCNYRLNSEDGGKTYHEEQNQ